MSGFLNKTILISFILIAIFSINNFVFSQESVTDSVSPIFLNTYPTNPRGGDSVSVFLSSEIIDLDSSRILWYIDGQAIKENYTKNIAIKTKNNSSNITIRAVIQTSDGIIREISKQISLSGVDLVLEPIAYTMPFYKGKPYFLAQGMAKVVAMPDVTINGVRESSKNLNFKWIKDGTVLVEYSGKGKDFVVVGGAIPVRDIDISVQIVDDSGNILTENSKLITKNNPVVFFYENSPLYGILYNKAIVNNYFLGTREELRIAAAPFSFGFLNDVSNNSSYLWYVNGNFVEQTGKANELILRQTTQNTKGIASISLDLRNINKINQFITDSFNIEFGI